LGYEPNELPDCSTPHFDHNQWLRHRQTSVIFFRHFSGWQPSTWVIVTGNSRIVHQHGWNIDLGTAASQLVRASVFPKLCSQIAASKI
jgi:hypothetical protein